MKKYKFITIRQVNNEMFEKKPVFRIFSNRSGAQLGVLSYYRPWKEYILSSRECVFNSTCLRDVLDFMESVIPIIQQVLSDLRGIQKK